jgi:hypothetical protein
MNKSILTILGTLGLAGIKRSRQGAWNKSQPIWTPLGFTWDSSRSLYHATVGFNKIKQSGRLKLRSQLMAQGQTNLSGAGGADRDYVSTTVDHKTALAIAVGVNILRKCAQGHFHYSQFDKMLESVHPGYRNSRYPRPFLEHKAEFSWTKDDPNYTEAVHNFDSCQRMYRDFLISCPNAFDPYFSSPEYKNYVGVDPNEIGLITGYSNIPFVSMTFSEALKLGGYISEYDRLLRWIDDKIHTYGIKKSLEGFSEQEYAFDASSYWTKDYPEKSQRIYGDNIQGVKLEWRDKQKISPDSVMTVNTGELEVEIWDPSKYLIDWSKSQTLEEMGLENSLFVDLQGVPNGF